MSFSFFNFFSKKHHNSFTTQDESFAVATIKSLAQSNDLIALSNVVLFHHNQQYTLPLVIFDKNRGIFLFEIKDWQLQDFQNATITKAQNTQPSENTLAFQYMQDHIHQKFNELIHNDGVALYNMLLLENMMMEEYNNLSQEHQTLLPYDKIIFKDTPESDILQKLYYQSKPLQTPLHTNKVLTNLFIQYTFVEDNTLYFANEEQRKFLDGSIDGFLNISAPHRSGATTIMLLKAIIEILTKKSRKVLIIKPSILTRDLLQKKLLAIIEHAIIEFDFKALEIVTPTQLLNIHHKKLGIPPLAEGQTDINEKLMRKPFDIADTIICDDTSTLSAFFVEYLKHIQKNKTLITLNYQREKTHYRLTKSFIDKGFPKVHFYHTTPFAKALHLLKELTKDPNNTVMCVASETTILKLSEDLEYFLETDISIIHSEKNLLYQEFHGLLLVPYNAIIDLHATQVIIFECDTPNKYLREYLFYRDHKTTVHILYKEQTHEIQHLKEQYETSTKK